MTMSTIKSNPEILEDLDMVDIGVEVVIRVVEANVVEIIGGGLTEIY